VTDSVRGGDRADVVAARPDESPSGPASEAPSLPLRAFSFGGGVQSTAALVDENVDNCDEGFCFT
jgi:hypothetical protein